MIYCQACEQLSRASFTVSLPAIMITPAFSAEFREAMEAAKGVSPNEGFQRCIEVIDKHNMWYEFEGTADNFLVHTENRSKLMINPTKAHRVGDQVHHAGADFKQLDAA